MTDWLQRLQRLYPGLTAKERVLLLVRAWKEGRKPDRRVLSFIPQSQAEEYNRLLALVQAIQGDVSHYLAMVSLLVGQADLRFNAVRVLHLWAISADEALFVLEAGGRFCAKGEGRKAMQGTCEESNDRHNGTRDGRVRAILRQAPLDLGSNQRTPKEAGNATPDEMMALYIERGREDVVLRWQELRAGELVVETAMAELDGEDLLHPDARAMLDGTKTTLHKLHEEVQRYAGEFPLKEPEDEQVEAVRHLVERAS